MVMVKRKSSTSISIQLFLACSINLLTLWWGKVLPICLPNYPLESSKSVWSCHLWYNEFHWMAMVDSCYLKYLFFSFLKQQYKIKFCLTEHLLLKFNFQILCIPIVQCFTDRLLIWNQRDYKKLKCKLSKVTVTLDF